jgi:hypothetical protein
MTDKNALNVLESWLRLAYHNADGTDEDSAELYEALQTTFALINRQKEEITRLQSMNQAKLDTIHDLRADIEMWESEIDKQYEQAKADILGNMADGGTSCHWCIEQHRSYAIKEFWDRLKEEGKKKVDYYTPEGCDLYFSNGTWCGYIAMKEAGDNLLKEMVGDDDD